jgi:hypothetical protein
LRAILGTESLGNDDVLFEYPVAGQTPAANSQRELEGCFEEFPDALEGHVAREGSPNEGEGVKDRNDLCGFQGKEKSKEMGQKEAKKII